MAFVNEYVPEEDVKKYGLEQINEQFLKSDILGTYSWTIDRERDIYLRWMGSGREEFCDQHTFTLYWKGTLMALRLRRKNIGGEGGRYGKGWATWELLHIEIPEALQAKKPEILDDLKTALTAYKEFGVYSTLTDHTATFEF